jgi:hypothetical protein
MAAIQIRKEFGPDVLHIVGTVHDAILMEVREDMAAVIYKRVLEIMSGPELFEAFKISLAIPIEADANLGPWGGGVPLDKWLKARETMRTPAVRKTPVKKILPKRKRA